MEALTGFAVLSLLSSLLLSLLPETRLKSTVHLVASLLLLLSWLTALQTLFLRFSQPESSVSAASPCRVPWARGPLRPRQRGTGHLRRKDSSTVRISPCIFRRTGSGYHRARCRQ